MSATLVRLDKADGSGPIDVNPDAVESLEPAAENSAKWSLVTLKGGHEAAVHGTVNEIAQKLGRSH